tara:strand:+ start:228 stop:1460 length:1233 start_codon:yes stop_codon:yes gene_type:complete
MKNFNLENTSIFLISVLPILIIVGSTASLIAVIFLSFIGICLFIFKKENRNIFFNRTVILLFIVYFYLILNSLISLNIDLGFARNLGFIRFIFLFLLINYFFKIEKNHNLIFKIWLLIIGMIVIDAYKEIITGTNFLGYGELYGNRIVSFFKDEPVVAAFLNGFMFILSGYLLNNFKEKNYFNKSICIITIILFVICVIFTGERSNTLKLIIGIVTFFTINKYFGIKIKLYLTISLLFVSVLAVSSSDYLKLRYITQIKNSIIGVEGQERLYFNLYKSGYEVFQQYPYFGVGNKNYRYETCNLEKLAKFKNYSCSTHPHQIYFEFLSEHGLVGTIILLSAFFYLIFRYLKIIIFSKNLVQLGSFVYLVTVFIPLLPSGAFFNDFNSTLFWINLSILYASNSQTNIFFKNK